MSAEPVVIHDGDREWETWPEDQRAERGESRWQTLISGGVTPSHGLTMGVARLAPGATLARHRHAQPEAYLVLGGAGTVTIDGATHAIEPGAAVFIPGDAFHSVESTGHEDLRIAYVFPTDAFEDVEYVFDRGEADQP